MTIKRNVGKEKEKFSELWFGTVFLSSCNVPYMKIENITTYNERVCNAVALETSEFVQFDDEDLVYPCYDAELLIP